MLFHLASFCSSSSQDILTVLTAFGLITVLLIPCSQGPIAREGRCLYLTLSVFLVVDLAIQKWMGILRPCSKDVCVSRDGISIRTEKSILVWSSMITQCIPHCSARRVKDASHSVQNHRNGGISGVLCSVAWSKLEMLASEKPSFNPNCLPLAFLLSRNCL